MKTEKTSKNNNYITSHAKVKNQKRNRLKHAIIEHIQLSEHQKIPIKITSNNSANSFDVLKFKNNHDKQIYITRSRRINKFNPLDLINKKQLIIDTRNEQTNTELISQNDNEINPKKSNKKKFNFIDYRRKKYQSNSKYRINQKIKNQKNNSNLEFEENLFDNFTIHNSNNNNKNFAITLTNFHQHEPVSNSLYTVLAMRKNQFMEAYNQAKEQEKASLPKIKQLQFLVDTSHIDCLYGKKNDYKKYIDSLNQPFSYISLLNDDYSISEKLRFQKIMDKFTKLEKYIEENPKKSKDIIKEFILSNGILNVNKYFDDEKLERFSNFLKGNFLIDPSKNIKENIINILEGKKLHKPPISNALDCVNRNDKSMANYEKFGTILSYEERNENMKDEEENNYKSKNINKLKNNNKNFRNKLVESKSVSNSVNKKEKSKLEYKGLCVNLKRQKEVYLSNKNKELDIINQPKYIIDMLEKTFKDHRQHSENLRAKTCSNWFKKMEKNNARLYGLKKDEVDYSDLKKKNLLTEYICLMKAKKHFEICKLKEKYNL